MTPHVASFPGPTQLFVAYSTEKWEDTMLSHFSVLQVTEGWVGPGNKATPHRKCNGI